MILYKLHKIPDRFIFRVIFILIILWNLKHFFLIFQIPYTLAFVDYKGQNTIYSKVVAIKNAVKSDKEFNDSDKIGFISDTPQASVFDLTDSILDFYAAQYAIVPVVLKNDIEKEYVIGVYDKKIIKPQGFDVYKKVNDKIYIYKKINNGENK